MTWLSIRAYGESAALIAVATALGLLTERVLSATNVNIVYLLVVLIIALRWGRRPATFTALLSTVVFTFCFIPPFFSFAITDLAYLTTLGGFLVIAIATNELASRSRKLACEQEALARAEARSEAKDELLNRISHEMRSPLNAVLGWNQLLARVECDHDRERRKAVAGIDHGGRLLARLVDDLLTASRIKAGKLIVDQHPVMLDPIIAKAVDLMTPTAHAKGVAVESTVDPVGYVSADEQRIEQIATNLLSNAIKFTSAGGQVSVRLRRTGNGAELVVSDTGVGIPADFLPHVFEQFTQADTRNAKEGLGLGLSIVKHLVDAHGGVITVASDGNGHGATFTVCLPIINPAHVSGHVNESPAHLRSTSLQ